MRPVQQRGAPPPHAARKKRSTSAADNGETHTSPIDHASAAARIQRAHHEPFDEHPSIATKGVAANCGLPCPSIAGFAEGCGKAVKKAADYSREVPCKARSIWRSLAQRWRR
jgi:hypothetical protein